MIYYKLDKNKNVIPAKDCMDWATAFEGDERTVKQEHIGRYKISTMFFGTSMLPESDPPLVFETMVFEFGKYIYCSRYPTWEAAEEGHEKAVQWVKDGMIETE